MQRQARRDTTPEMQLRRELHRLGLRYRVNVRPLQNLRRRADVVFRRAKVAVEIRGCFWHFCPRHGMLPDSNYVWWKNKLKRNRQRDAETEEHLKAAGWILVVVWEHESPVKAASMICRTVRRRSLTRTHYQHPVHGP
jgi:DNA mismatch endonuclease (patch repair protein)